MNKFVFNRRSAVVCPNVSFEWTVKQKNRAVFTAAYDYRRNIHNLRGALILMLTRLFMHSSGLGKYYLYGSIMSR